MRKLWFGLPVALGLGVLLGVLLARPSERPDSRPTKPEAGRSRAPTVDPGDKVGAVPAAPHKEKPKVQSAPVVQPPPSQSAPAYDRSRTKAWKEGFLEAKDLPWDGALTGTVLGPSGPQPEATVRIQWVVAYLPPHPDGALFSHQFRDEDGTVWHVVDEITDENGAFRLDRVPNVQLRVKVGQKTITAFPSSPVQISVDK
jgi:hypothetical protein